MLYSLFTLTCFVFKSQHNVIEKKKKKIRIKKQLKKRDGDHVVKEKLRKKM